MARSSLEYWRQREAAQRDKNITEEAEYEKHIQKIYADTLDRVNKEINGFFVKYATKEGITIAEAKRRVSKLDIKEYSEKAKRYVEEKNFSEKANEEMRLYNLTMKVNRLELLKANIGLELIDGFSQLENYEGKILNDRTLAEMERQAGILGETVLEPAKKAHAIVNASFHNAQFSDRIWMYQDMLKSELSILLTRGLIQGLNPRQLAVDIKKRFGVSLSNATRLMRTEMARVQIGAQKQSYERNGYEEYEFIALTGHACEDCQALDGKHFQVIKMQPGLNAPPMHPNCRCSTTAYMNRESFEKWLDSEAVQREMSFDESDKTVKFASSPTSEKNRAIRFGDSNSFEQYGRTVHTREVKNSGNHLHVDKSISLSRKQIRDIDGMISRAKELHGISYTCNAPFVITDNGERIASYNPRTNTFFIDYRMADLEKITLQQQGFAAPDNIYSTAVHEIFHWKDAEEYRKTGNVIDKADFKSIYSQHNREISKRKLQEAGIDLSNPIEIVRISQYAYLKWLENDLEEVYTEYRTRELLKE